MILRNIYGSYRELKVIADIVMDTKSNVLKLKIKK